MWPPPGAEAQRLYLSDDGALGALPAHEGSVEWVHDPQHLVPSTIVDPFAFLLEYPDENEVAARDDLAVFTSEPLSAPLTLAGRVVAHLNAGTDGPSMNLHVKLVDVAPGGEAHILLYGQRRVAGGDMAEVYLGHTGHRIPAGHRLRLQVASSDYPLYLPHPGTSESAWFATETRPNHQHLRIGGTAPSHLSISVVGE
jgi:hypothetical protein